jgi:hypothetical protein
MTVEILADSVADGERVVPEKFVQNRDIVVDEGLLVPGNLLEEFCMHLRVVDFPRLSLRRIHVMRGNAHALLTRRSQEVPPGAAGRNAI